MAREPNPIETVEIKVRTTPVVSRYLEALVASGLYGKSRSEAAERLIAAGIQSLIREGTLARAKTGGRG